MDFITEIMCDLKPYRDLVVHLNDKNTPIATFGLAEQGIGHLLYSIKGHTKKTVLFITYDELKAKRIFEDLKNLGTENLYFCQKKEIFFFDRAATSQDQWKQRLETFVAIIENRVDIIVTTVDALMDHVMNPKLVKENIIKINQSGEYDLQELINSLVEIGYERVSQVEGMGQFSLRGGILDVYSVEENPYRIEFFDTEVDSIRSFSSDSQRSIEVVEEITIVPIQEFFILEEFREEIIKNLARDIEASKQKDTTSEGKQEEKFNKYLEYLENKQFISNMDLMIPYYPKEALGNFFDYFKSPPNIFLDEPRRIEEYGNRKELEFKENYVELRSFGEVLKKHEFMSLEFETVKEIWKKHSLVLMNSIVKSLQDYEVKMVCNFYMKSVVNYRGKMILFRTELTEYVEKGYKTVILGGSEEKSKRLVQNITEMGLSCEFRKSREKPFGESSIIITPGGISEGFEYPELKFVLFNYGEIYGLTKDRKKRKKRKQKELNFTDLKPGDYVVHESHGIGQYIGTEQLEVKGVKKDYINISYRGGDKLFLPIDQLSYIHKYIGGEGKTPKINKLNSAEWSKTKQRAKKSVEDMAEDLIALYASRENKNGFSFSEDSEWQREFEDAFPFEETDGQLTSIEQIKRDMMKQKPMDRLLCADVGYGKTEVALRAAFKAVLDGKQVAFLVPTTILAQQHYNTMMERFADFPVEIVVLSRFRTAKQQREDLSRLKKGMVDIVVGTHRLLSKDVKFKDLGLLIIDEEQRFGVRHKEQLKMIKESVDTLTLTATPIPRTLQMSMIGIRDMSVIEEPPEERFPIQTYVLEYNPLMIRDAIIKELERGGQVYFVYNRVSNMEMKLRELRELVPEAKIAMAHGQMGETLLEDTMLAFVNREVDVLLCSTIIETGMDVANANTMIISESNRLGLSQLYQLRGRIGRSNRIAYAYFTYERDVSISEIAEKRLRSIKEFTEFGSGYKIAMRDLEIRGSGSILGAQQSGHMGSIGYDLYVKYLREAVGKLKGVKEEEKVETVLDIGIDAYISEKYIENQEQRIEQYKKISVIENEEDYVEVLDEMIDRYGDIPEATSNLMDLSMLRVMASSVNVESINQLKNTYQLNFVPDYKMDLSIVNELKHKFGNMVNISMGETPNIHLASDKYPLEDIKEVLKILQIHKKITQNKEESCIMEQDIDERMEME